MRVELVVCGQGTPPFQVAIDRDLVYDLRDALYDDHDDQSSPDALIFIEHALSQTGDSDGRLITPPIAGDLIRGIDRLVWPRPLPSELVELRNFLEQLRAPS